GSTVPMRLRVGFHFNNRHGGGMKLANLKLLCNTVIARFTNRFTKADGSDQQPSLVRRAVIGVSLIVLLTSVLASAQKPYEAVSGSTLDSVSLTTGGLTLGIPLASFPQRGKLDLSFFIRYNTLQWQENQTCVPNPDVPGSQTCTSAWVPGPGQIGAVPASSM